MDKELSSEQKEVLLWRTVRDLQAAVVAVKNLGLHGWSARGTGN